MTPGAGSRERPSGAGPAADGVLHELLGAGRRPAELESVSGAALGDIERWIAGNGAPTPEQEDRLTRWRTSLAAGIEAATGHDLREPIPAGMWRTVGEGTNDDPVLRPSPWPDDARVWIARRRRAMWAACAELLARAAESEGGWKAVNGELDDLTDELRRRAAGWRLSARDVTGHARAILRDLSAAGVPPVEAWVVVHRDVRWLDFVVWWPARIGPRESETSVAARIAALLSVSPGTVTVRWATSLDDSNIARARGEGVDLVAAIRQAGAVDAAGEVAPGPSTSVGTSGAELRARLEDALGRHARDLAWALRVDGVAPVDAWAQIVDTVTGPEIWVVAEWPETDGVPKGCEQSLREEAAAHLGVAARCVQVYGAPDLPLAALVGLATDAVRLIPERRDARGHRDAE